jgi:hypothetical protein
MKKEMLGETVYYIENNKICKSFIVKEIVVRELDMDNDIISARSNYRVDDSDDIFSESEIFLTKEDIIKNLQ